MPDQQRGALPPQQPKPPNGRPGDPLAKPPPQPVGIPETTAATLWCPYMDRRFDPDGKIHSDSCCIVGACMLWHSDVGAPNSDQPTGWCSMSTLAPGEAPSGLLRSDAAPALPTPSAA